MIKALTDCPCLRESKLRREQASSSRVYDLRCSARRVNSIHVLLFSTEVNSRFVGLTFHHSEDLNLDSVSNLELFKFIILSFDSMQTTNCGNAAAKTNLNEQAMSLNRLQGTHNTGPLLKVLLLSSNTIFRCLHDQLRHGKQKPTF